MFRIKLSLKLITEALEPFGAQLILERDRQYGFTKVQILYEPCDELDKETLYMCMPRVLSRMRRSAFEDNCFVFFARPEQVQCRHIVCGIMLDPAYGMGEVINCLINLFTNFNTFEREINELALNGSGINAVFKLAEPYFEDGLLIAVDAAFNIICASKRSVEHPYVNNILQRGYYNHEDLNQMAMRGYYEDERKYTRPVLYDASKTICGLPWIVRSYRTGGVAFSFVGCYVLNGQPSAATLALFTVLTNSIEKYYSASGDFKLGTTMEGQLFDDLISYRNKDKDYLRDHCYRLKLPFQGPFRMGIICTQNDTPIKSSQIMNQLRGRCPVDTYGIFLYKNKVALVLKDWSGMDVKNLSVYDDNWKDLTTILKANKAHIGLSLTLKDVSEFPVGYQQAGFSLKRGLDKDPGRVCYLYSDWYLDDILNVYAGVMPLEHVYVQKLNELLDEPRNNISSIKVLYYFLVCERNISLTGQKLFMHRNSVIYRIQKIKETLAMDLDDPNIRLRLLLSMKILVMLGKIPNWSPPLETGFINVE